MRGTRVNDLVCGQFEVHVFDFDRKGENFCWAMRGNEVRKEMFYITTHSTHFI